MVLARFADRHRESMSFQAGRKTTPVPAGKTGREIPLIGFEATVQSKMICHTG